MLTHSDSVRAVPTAPTHPSTPAAARRAAPLPADERRAAIVEAVIPLLLEHGSSVTSRQIAEAAQVSEGTVFKVFVDKDELIAAAVERAIDPAPFERAIAELDPDAPLVDRLTAATELIRRRVGDIWRLVSRVGVDHHPPGGRPLPDSPALIALIGSDADELRLPPAEAARLLRALTLSQTHPLLAAEPASASDIVEVFLHGVDARP